MEVPQTRHIPAVGLPMQRPRHATSQSPRPARCLRAMRYPSWDLRDPQSLLPNTKVPRDGGWAPAEAPLPAWGTRKSKAPAPGDVPRRGRHGKKSRRPPTLPHCGAVPSAQPGLTSLFGMGRGGAPAQWPPGMDDDTSAQGLATEGGTRRARRRKAGGRERAGTPHTLRGAPGGRKVSGN